MMSVKASTRLAAGVLGMVGMAWGSSALAQAAPAGGNGLMASVVDGVVDGVGQAMDHLRGPGHWRVAVSPFSTHFHYNPLHRYVWAVGIERQGANDWMGGASYFSNSFGQPSAYVYVGRRWWNWFGQPQAFTQFSGGMLYGYRGDFKNKVPFNYKGFSPGALISAGWQFDANRSVAVHMLGDAGLMVQLAWDFK